MGAATGLHAGEPITAWRGRGAAFRRLAFAAWLMLVTSAQLAMHRLAWRLVRVRARFAATILAAAGLTAFLAATLLPDTEEPLRAASVIAVPEMATAPAPLRRSEPEAPGPVVVLPPAPEPWRPVRRPIPLYNLESPEIDRLALRYQVEIRGRGERRDTLAWASREPAAGPALIVIAAERYEAGAPTARPFFPDLAARAAAQGLAIERLSRTGEIATKFGAMEIADAILDAEGLRLACLAFRRNDAAGLTLAGWFCGSSRRPADRVGFGCFIDRLDLVAAGRDRELKRLFAAAERNRRGCGQGRVGARKASWLDHEAPAPVLKLTTRAK